MTRRDNKVCALISSYIHRRERAMVQCAFTLHSNTTMNERTAKLRALMAKHKLQAADVAEILDRTPQTVRVWRCDYEARTIPADALRVLEMTLAQRGKAA